MKPKPASAMHSATCGGPSSMLTPSASSTSAEPDLLVECAEQAKPMLVLADLEPARNDVCGAISRLKQNAATQHLPVIAVCGENAAELQSAARGAGASLVVSEGAIVGHLEQFLEQALHVE